MPASSRPSRRPKRLFRPTDRSHRTCLADVTTYRFLHRECQWEGGEQRTWMTPLALPLEAYRAMPKWHGNSHRPVTGASYFHRWDGYYGEPLACGVGGVCRRGTEDNGNKE